MGTIGTNVRNTVGALALLTMIPVSGWAAWGPGGGGYYQGPPQEAFDACAGKKAGDEVRFTTPRGDNVVAVCREFDGKLAARPDWGAAGGPGWRGRDAGRRGMGPGWAGHGPRGGGRGMGMGLGQDSCYLTEALKLSPEQKAKIQAIREEEGKKVSALRKELWDSRDQIWEAAVKAPYDEAALRKLAAEREGKRTELFLARAGAMNRVKAVLTPEQKAQAEKLGFRGRGPGMGRAGGPGPGRGYGQGRPDCPYWK